MSSYFEVFSHTSRYISLSVPFLVPFLLCATKRLNDICRPFCLLPS